MARSVVRIGAVIATTLLFTWIYIGCSDEDACPTCPDGGGTGATLALDVMHPQPDPIHYNDVFAATSDDIFVAAEGGVVLRWQGTDWARYDTPVVADLRSVWGTSHTDVWAVGLRGVIVHFDGASWSTMDSGVLNDLEGVWGTSPTNVYAVGDGNTVLRYMGTSWEPMNLNLPPSTRDFREIFGFNAADIYVAGTITQPSWAGVVAQFDGGNWTEATFVTTMNGVWGASPDTVYAVDNYGSMWHNSGAGWESQLVLGDALRSISGSAWNDIWAVGSRWDVVDQATRGTAFHYDGTGWTELGGESFPFQLQSVDCVSSTESYVVGDWSQVADWDGSTWEPLNDAWATVNTLYGVWGFDNGDLLAVGAGGTMILYDGDDWLDIPASIGPVTDQYLYSVWASDADTVYAVGGGSTIIWHDGAQWEEYMHPFFVGTLRSVWGTSTNDVRFGGDLGYMIHDDGIALHVDTVQAAAGGAIVDMWASARDDWYAVTYSGVVHYDGSSWSPIRLDGHQITVVSGVSATEVYFAGRSTGGAINVEAKKPSKVAGPTGRGILLRYNGSTYTEVAMDFDMSPFDVWAEGTNNIFLAGNAGDGFAVGHFNGSRVAIGTNSSRYQAHGLWATGRTAYAVGSNGLVVHTTAR